MNVKKAITIGLLTIATIGLVGCAIILNKHKEYTPKTLDVYATDLSKFTKYEDQDTPYTSQANTNNMLIFDIDVENLITNTDNQATNTLKIRTTIKEIILENYTCQFTQTNKLNSINITNYNTTINKISLTFINITASNLNQITRKVNINIQYQYLIQNNNTTIATTGVQNLQINNADTNATLVQFIQTQNPINIGQFTIQTYTPAEYDAFSNGVDNGYETAYEDAYDIGYESGEEYGYQTGYSAGYQAKGDLGDGNFLDIRNMMLSVLTMPFTFINQAFNVTLWEGTAYAFNIGNFIKGLIAIASILFIIRLFTSGFSLIGNYTDDRRARNDTHKLRQAQTQKAKAETRRTNKLADKGK